MCRSSFFFFWTNWKPKTFLGKCSPRWWPCANDAFIIYIMDGSISYQTVNEELWMDLYPIRLLMRKGGSIGYLSWIKAHICNGDLNSCIVKWVMPADYCVLMKNYEWYWPLDWYIEVLEQIAILLWCMICILCVPDRIWKFEGASTLSELVSLLRCDFNSA